MTELETFGPLEETSDFQGQESASSADLAQTSLKLKILLCALTVSIELHHCSLSPYACVVCICVHIHMCMCMPVETRGHHRVIFLVGFPSCLLRQDHLLNLELLDSASPALTLQTGCAG